MAQTAKPRSEESGAATNRGNVGPATNAIVRTLRELESVLDARPDDMVSRMVLASLRLDLGEHDRAVSEFGVLVDEFPSPSLDACAARYARLDRSRSGHAALDLDGLPEPVSGGDHVVAAFHVVRARKRGFLARAEALLRAAVPE